VIRPISLSVAALLAVGLPSFAFAQTGMNGINQTVMALDKNFDVADKDRDGKLTREEAKAGPVAFIATNFDAIDKNHTGFVTKTDVHTFIAAGLMKSQPKAPARPAGEP